VEPHDLRSGQISCEASAHGRRRYPKIFNLATLDRRRHVFLSLVGHVRFLKGEGGLRHAALTDVREDKLGSF
jgi:hypothetical protein